MQEVQSASQVVVEAYILILSRNFKEENQTQLLWAERRLYQ